MQLLVQVFGVMLAFSSPVRSGVVEPDDSMSAGIEKMKEKLKQGFANVKTQVDNDVAAVKQGFHDMDAKLNEPQAKKVEKEVEIGLIAGGSAAALTAAASGIAYGVAHQKPPLLTFATTTTTTVTTIDVNAAIRYRVAQDLSEKDSDSRIMIFWLVIVLFVVLGILVCACSYYLTKKSYKSAELSDDEHSFGPPVSECKSSRDLRDFVDPEGNDYDHECSEGLE